MLPPLLARRARRARTRRLGAVFVVVLAVVGVLSAVTPPFRERFGPLLEVLPLGVPLLTKTVLVPVSIALLLLARGLRQGQRLAWVVTLVLLATSAVLHLLKGIDVEEAVLDVVLLVWLSANARSFPVLPSAARTRRAARVLTIGAVLTLAVSAALVVAVGEERHPRETTAAVVERLVGDSSRPLPVLRGDESHVFLPLLNPSLLALGITLVVVLGWVLFSPHRPETLSPEQRLAERERARAVVLAHGGDTLDYFALRDDKDFFFVTFPEGEGVVAYSVRNGVCLVSPDPIAPPERGGALLTEFLDLVERSGWSVAVVGAGTDWLPSYEAVGLRPVYLGDEAVLDCTKFSLKGSSMKSLRGSVNRVTKAGISVEFLDGPTVPAEVKAELLAISGQSRQGEAERGYSMTLSRLFDPADTGVLVSVARFDDGRPAGFIQWTPAAKVEGYSLDVMRRSTAEDVPNGLTDALIVATAAHLAENGGRGLGLNFAVLRELVAGEREGAVADLGRRALHALSRSAQIESLWKFNAKYDPTWKPRYVVLDSVEFAAAQGLTIAGAEGVAELPVVGRFLGRRP
ncbi:bifunctional lysylphosphatidylglycerol flippase/synthetase MprF [Kineococcus rhizosphaerae]|uniref:Lysyl-tRNA synthetase class 2 n=1 Tax=Kineococcus rhizosphaerae TaxID=559628 RepID=A0A2T0R578_9ACTN|nr:phosphatidylglycerol lysyltransferase domain-containing protein [Kineococcus rhizosphaerae]PRY15923.1 lysyl-tRNA synthetase class 2 [Kineococcus rhizosphaerae]